jgi:hypothetical protein
LIGAHGSNVPDDITIVAPDPKAPDAPALEALKAPDAVKPEAQDADALKAQIATLTAALDATTKAATEQATTLQSRLAAVEAEAVTERRTSALTKIGLPAAYHDVAPQGDPRDPKVAEAIEKWAGAHPLLLQSRAPSGPQVDIETIAKSLPGGGKGLTNMSNMAENWETMRGGK